MNIKDKMRRDWDRRAQVDPYYWVAATEAADAASYAASATHDVAALLDGLSGRVHENARVLDLGCGIGRLTAPLAASFAEVVGVDVSVEMVEKAKALHDGVERCRFEANSGTDLSGFATESFDLVVSYSVLPHLPPAVVASYFVEINRVLKPGAWFRFQFWIGPRQQQAANDTLGIRVYDAVAFGALCQASGFEQAEVEEIDYLDPVLNLKPVWINARKVGPATDTTGLLGEEGGGVDEEALEHALLMYLAVKHQERGEIDDAERVLETALQIAPTRVEAYVQWAAIRIERDDLKGAAMLFEALTEKVPTSAIGWLYRARIACSTDRFRTALSHLDRFVALSSDEPTLLEEATEIRTEARTGLQTKKGRKRRLKNKKS